MVDLPQITTIGVMQQVILGQFWVARDALYSPSLPLSPAQVCHWLCFLVLEATRNSTVDARKGGGIYSLEAFPLQTCN
jgi:hypothetical protein